MYYGEKENRCQKIQNEWNGFESNIRFNDVPKLWLHPLNVHLTICVGYVITWYILMATLHQ